ncbi:hypothetical protein P0Y31_12325 [Knoellia sp. 3-2P3]|uniref:hypothetical protein n=1 Tax=unclassified Knoellia TaxID=2618719 RepID=UPI0023DCD590|nr:hypothetical protein [Knoellia sp. 3-2P3]MDF2093131.1 hypothetical protein [Knoellia sp. 3-2P3]
MSSRAPRSYPMATEPTDLPLLRGEAFAGWLVGRVVVAAAAWVLLGAAACGLLALAGLWQPLVAAVVLLVLAAVAVRVAALVPSRPMPVWVALALAVVALGTTLWAGLTHSEQVLPRRDSGSYLQSSLELARGHERPIELSPESVGGPDVLRIDGITLDSPAFYQVGTPEDPAIQPQFPIGPSAWYSLAWWLGGAGAAFWAPAVLGGLGVLAFGLLAALTVGPRWSPLAALGLALCFPLLHVNRSTYSEPLAVLVLMAAMAALVQASRAARAREVAVARAAAAVAGGLVGAGVLVRVDSLREVVLLVPVAALAAAQRQPHARSLLLAAGGSAAAAFGLTWLTSSEYLRSIAGSLLPLVALGVAVVVVCAALLRAGRHRRLPAAAAPWLLRAGAAAVVLVALVLASRPLWQTVRQSAADPGSRVVAGLQLRQGLPVDGGRTYAEQSLVWMSWWVGPVALVIALVAAVALVRRALRAWTAGRDLQPWVGPLLVGLGSSVLTWYRPGITPDHPWADRRLVIALPTVILLVVAAAAVCTRWSARRMPAPVLVATSALAVLALLVPTALATWPHATERVEKGELAAVEQVCRSFRPGDVALMVDSRAANEWPQVLRGQCGVSALSTTGALRKDREALADAVTRVSRAVEDRGMRLVLLGADSDEGVRSLSSGEVEKVLDTTVLEDPRLLERRPDHLVTLPLQVWLAPAR